MQINKKHTQFQRERMMNINSRKQLIHISVDVDTYKRSCIASNATIKPDDTNHIIIMYLCINTHNTLTRLLVEMSICEPVKLLLFHFANTRQCGKHIDDKENNIMCFGIMQTFAQNFEFSFVYFNSMVEEYSGRCGSIEYSYTTNIQVLLQKLILWYGLVR